MRLPHTSHKVNIAWEAGFSDPSMRSIDGLHAGDKIIFTWSAGEHNVYQMANKLAFGAHAHCQFVVLSSHPAALARVCVQLSAHMAQKNAWLCFLLATSSAA